MIDVMPGDMLDSGAWQVCFNASERVTEEFFESYIRSYASRYEQHFAAHRNGNSAEAMTGTLGRLKNALQAKLDAFKLRARVTVPLYFGFTDFEELLRIDFPQNRVEHVMAIRDADFYSLKAPSWQIQRVLDGAITWEEFALTFRMRLNRRPDVYQTLIQGFLLMEPEDMNWFCARLLEIEERGKRIVIEADGIRYSIDQFCPHQGADLSQGWLADGKLWTCPRHRWQFDLTKGGQCVTSGGSIHAVCLESD